MNCYRDSLDSLCNCLAFVCLSCVTYCASNNAQALNRFFLFFKRHDSYTQSENTMQLGINRSVNMCACTKTQRQAVLYTVFSRPGWKCCILRSALGLSVCYMSLHTHTGTHIQRQVSSLSQRQLFGFRILHFSLCVFARQQTSLDVCCDMYCSQAGRTPLKLN